MAKSAFRNERLLEPLDLYNRCFATFADIFRKLIEKLPDSTAEPVDAEIIAELVALAKKVGLDLHQSYARVGKFALIKQQRYAHAKQ